MGGFGGLFAGLSRGFGGRLLQRSDEDREAARRQYEHEINMLESVGLSPDADPQAAEAALRLASERHNAYLKSIGQKPKDIPDFYGTLADMMKGRGGTTAATTAGENPNQPSQDTGVPNLFSTEGAHLPVAGQGGPMSPIATGQQGGGGGLWRDPLAAKERELRMTASVENEQKQIEMNRRKQAIYGEVNAGRMTPEAGARAVAALEVGFPLPSERAAQPKYELFTNDRGDVEYVAEGSKIPAGYKPYEKDTGPKAGTFQARYADKLAELQASNPGITETDAHTQVMAALGQEDKQKQAKAELDRKNAEALLASRQRAATEKAETGTLTSTTARTILSTALGVANRKVQQFTDYNARPKDPKEAAQYDSRVEEIFNSEFASAVELQSGMGVAEVQAIVKARPGDSSGSGRSARYRTK